MEDPGVDVRIILKQIFDRLDGEGGIDWIDLAQDRNRWRALVNTVMNLRVPNNVGNFLSRLGRVSFSGRTVLHGVRGSLQIKHKFESIRNIYGLQAARVTKVL